MPTDRQTDAVCKFAILCTSTVGIVKSMIRWTFTSKESKKCTAVGTVRTGTSQFGDKKVYDDERSNIG